MIALLNCSLLTGIILGIVIISIIFCIEFNKQKPFCLDLDKFDYNLENKTPSIKLEIKKRGIKND
jgi:hypothetical protein